jgi:hypothetical protein
MAARQPHPRGTEAYLYLYLYLFFLVARTALFLLLGTSVPVGLTGVFSEEPGGLHGGNIFALPELSSAVPEWTTAGRIATERVVCTLPHNRSE